MFTSYPGAVRWRQALLLPGSLALLLTAFLATGTSNAADPSSGSVSSGQTETSWQGGPFIVSNAAACPAGIDTPGCDRFMLTITPPAGGGHVVDISISPDGESDDFDLFVYGPDGAEAGSSASAGGAETVSLNEPEAGTYEVIVQAWLVDVGATYAGTAALGDLPGGGSGAPQPSPEWTVSTHGACCEGNLAAEGDNTFVLAPVLVTGNKIIRSSDGGRNWEETYPPADLSVPFGIEGDLHAYENDVIYFGTELSHGVVARSVDRGSNWTVFQVPVAFVGNDQAWAFLGPANDMCEVQAAPYVMAGWFRIGTVMLFSCDGGRTWPIQTPLVGVNGSGPEHTVCKTTAREPADAGDTRVPSAEFARQKAGRHGSFGPDGRFYWSESDGESLYVCHTDNFGAEWDGIAHPLAKGTPAGITVTWAAFDDNGTFYVLHGNKLYVSYDRGESMRHVHTLPRWGNDAVGDTGSAQFFVVNDGTIQVGLRSDGPGARGDIYYLRGEGVDTANPSWSEELVDLVQPGSDGTTVRLDFMQLVVDDNGIPTIGYTTANGGTTTASRLSPPRVGDEVPANVDVTHRVELITDNASFGDGQAAFDLRLRNTSSGTLFAPIAAEIESIESPSGRVTANNTDNGAGGAGAFWRYDDQLNGDDRLIAGETSTARRLGFSNPDEESFDVVFRILSGEESAATDSGSGANLAESPLFRLTLSPASKKLEIVPE